MDFLLFSSRCRTGAWALVAVLFGILTFAPASSGFEPAGDEGSDLSSRAFFKPELYISTANLPLEEVLPQLPNQAAWESFQAQNPDKGAGPVRAFIDPRSGTATNILGAFPLIPGDGVGNAITLADLDRRIGYRAGNGVSADAVLAAVLDFVRGHRETLGVDVDQLGAGHAAKVTEELWQVSIPQTFHGIPVRYGRVAATVSHGNLIVLGTETWGNVKGLSPVPLLSSEQALAAGFGHVGGATELDVLVLGPTLEVIPVAPQEHQRGPVFGGPLGDGYEHRLSWTFAFRRAPEHATWEMIVDAQSGEVLAMQDLNHYLEGQITGGVYPITSTEICPTPGTCGEMQTGWPMPWANTGLAAPNNFTNSAGLIPVPGANLATTLSGQYVRISDNCGTIAENGAGNLDLGGVNGQHDCTTPAGSASAGNTPASRTAFYELNRIAELARGWLPNNTWLQSQLTANVNINLTCNAFWNGATVNFYRSGGGCRNTGELAGVFDHEWGHGLDDNDAGGALSNTSEAYADIAGIFRLQDSCIGHGFFETVDDGCGLTVDGTGFNSNEAQTGAAHCNTNCSGVRDADWTRHVDGLPDTPLGFVCGSCSASTGPCGRQVHCSAAPPRQAAWDLVTRDLTAAPFNLDSHSAFILGNKLFYQGSGNIGTWYSCTCGSSSSGCGATNAYMQWLAADDDNGNLNDGTPHMTALFAAFDRHGIACATPTPTNGGCAGAPTGAPTVTATAGDNQVSLAWSAVSGASEYWVFRTEGHAGCNFGKTKIAELAGTSYLDTEVAGGRDYHYTVVAAGTSAACFGPAASCQTVTPIAPPPQSPSVSITAPATGSFYDDGDSITFTGTASDPQEGDLSAQIAWSSSLDGALGTGASITTSTLSVGNHTITAAVTDLDGFTGSDSISITVRPACATEVYACDFESDQCGFIEGASTCTTGFFIRGTPDPVTNGGVVTQPAGAAAGTFAFFTQNNTGGAGIDDVDNGTCETLSQIVTVGTGSTVSVFVDYFHGQRDAGGDPPDGFVIDLIDADNPSVVVATVVSFGDVTNNAVWTAASAEVTGAPNRLRMRVRATDSPTLGDLVEGGIDNVRLCTNGTPPPNTAPVVTITAPANGSTFTEGDSITFTGTATDAEDGDLSAAITWSSSIDGVFGTGASVSTSALSAGTHTITASVTDSGSLSGSDAISITINAAPVNQAPVVTITAPANGSSFTEGTAIGFTGTATDAEDGNLTAGLAWTSSLDGPIGTGGSFSAVLSVGTHTITASVTDSGGLGGSAAITVTVTQACLPSGASCTDNAQCCSGNCKGKPGQRTCK